MTTPATPAPLPAEAVEAAAAALKARHAEITPYDEPELRADLVAVLEAAAPHLAAAAHADIMGAAREARLDERERIARLAESEARRTAGLGGAPARFGGDALRDFADLLRQGGGT